MECWFFNFHWKKKKLSRTNLVILTEAWSNNNKVWNKVGEKIHLTGSCTICMWTTDGKMFGKIISCLVYFGYCNNRKAEKTRKTNYIETILSPKANKPARRQENKSQYCRMPLHRIDIAILMNICIFQLMFWLVRLSVALRYVSSKVDAVVNKTSSMFISLDVTTIPSWTWMRAANLNGADIERLSLAGVAIPLNFTASSRFIIISLRRIANNPKRITREKWHSRNVITVSTKVSEPNCLLLLLLRGGLLHFKWAFPRCGLCLLFFNSHMFAYVSSG